MDSHRRARAALVALGVAAFTYVTSEVLPTGLLTVIAADLDRSRSQIGLLVSGYAVVVVLMSVPLTRLTHRVPRRQLLTGALGIYVLASVVTAVAPNYPVLFAGRLAIALTQALFWSVVTSTAISLYPPAVRGRVIARLNIGNSLAPVLGVPAGTWLGQQAGWRVAFAALAGLGFLTCLAVAFLLPTVAPAASTAARGVHPDPRRYAILVAVTALAVTGAITTFTYVTPFLLDVSDFGAAALGPLLFVSGAAGLVGTLTVARFLDRRPWGALAVPLGAMAVALLGLYGFGPAKLPAVVLLGVTGLAFSAMVAAVANRTMQVAPASTDLAAAGVSTAFNVGIAAGAALGGVLITGTGVRSVALAGAVLVALALAILLLDPLQRYAVTSSPLPACGGPGDGGRLS